MGLMKCIWIANDPDLLLIFHSERNNVVVSLFRFRGSACRVYGLVTCAIIQWDDATVCSSIVCSVNVMLTMTGTQCFLSTVSSS